jgi:hypothetical protein
LVFRIGSVLIYPPSMIVPETRRRGIILTLGLVVLGIACAPEPTEIDTNIDVGGVWTSNAHLFGLSQIGMKLVQEKKGIVSGTWTAKGDGGTGGCPPDVPCDASGTVIGLNTVSKSDIELLGAATFEGVLVEPGILRGALIHPIGYDTITFIRTSK